MATKKKKTRKTSSRKISMKRTTHPSYAATKKSALSYLSYRNLEAEINRLTDLLNLIKKKSSLVRRSLAYLEREQKKVTRQIHDAKRFINKLRARGLEAWRNFPGNAEDLYYQLKREFNKISKRLRSAA
jgi:septal ring factor EnvC (AmiA/AmiB activator)